MKAWAQQLFLSRFSSHFWEYPGSVTIVVVSLMFLWQSTMVLLWPFALRATCLTAIVMVWQLSGNDDGLEYILLVMVLAAMCAIVGTSYRFGRIRFMLFLPQHLLLGIMAIGGIVAAWFGEYLDGTVIPWQQISADQIGYVVLFVMYSIAIMRRARIPDG